jgi:hypothetical protein
MWPGILSLQNLVERSVKSASSMVLITDLDLFQTQAEAMIRQFPAKARLTTKIRKSPPIFTMQITDGKLCYKMKITKDATMRAAYRVVHYLLRVLSNPGH